MANRIIISASQQYDTKATNNTRDLFIPGKPNYRFLQTCIILLFGIFGSVGSGKSSILEAITFALFNKTERLGDRDNRSYNMMNLRSNEMFIEFIFEAGKENKTFKIVCKAKRNRNNFDNISQNSRNIYIQNGESWMPVKEDILEPEIGLSYENFKRTIIIPQGKFQEFLHLTDKERTKMMKELFHLERFDLSDKVLALNSKNKSELENIKGQLEQLGDVNQDQKDQYEKQISSLEEEIKIKSKTLDNLQKEEGRLSTLKKLSEKLNNAGNTLTILEKEQPAYNALEIKLKQFEQCRNRFKSLIDTYQESTKKIEEKKILLKNEGEQLEKTKVALDLSHKELDKIKPDYEKRETLKNQAGELDLIIRIKNKELEEEGKRANWEKANKEQKRIAELINELESKINIESELIITKEQLLPDLSMIGDIKVWHSEITSLGKQKVEFEKEIRDLQEEANSIEKSIEAILQDKEFQELAANSELPEIIQFINSKITVIKEEKKSLEKDTEHYRLQKKLESFSTQLEDGQACPLCGSPDHPDVLSVENVDEELSSLNIRIKEHENRIENFLEKDRKLEELGLKKESNTKSFNENILKRGAIVEGLKMLNSNYLWDDELKDKLNLENTISESEKIQRELKDHKNKLSELTTQLKDVTKNKEEEDEKIKKAETSLLQIQTEIKTIIEGLQISSFEDYREKSESDITGDKNNLLERYNYLEESFRRISAQLDELGRTEARTSGSRDANLNELEREEQNKTSITLKIDKELKDSKFSNITEVEKILSEEIDLEGEKQRVSDFREKLLLVKENIKTLTEEIAGKKYESAAHIKILGDITLLNISIKEEGEKLGGLKSLLKTLISNLKSLKELSKEKNRLELRAANLSTLISLFRGSGFVNYISSIYLKNLCKAANDRFVKLSRQSLSLELTDDNSFQIRDFLNGGEVRSVKTLSGGQTFQAALSLALALSDNIQHLAGADQNFFFLDEGFGSLDKESLAVVFDTLKTLQKENRIVGLISHVDEMQQEIDSYLKVTNYQDRGSIVETSWDI